MKPDKLKTLDEFIEESSALQQRFEQLALPSPNDLGSVRLVAEVQQWLLVCLAHGKYLPTGSYERSALRSIVEKWKLRLRREGHRLDGIGDLQLFDPTAGVVLGGECPYPGLDAYRADKADSFFGRQALTKRYAGHLIEKRIFLIIGASGSGKSSVALAGIRPHLQRDIQCSNWLYPDDITPGPSPIHALAISIARAAGQPEEAAALERAMRDNPASALTRMHQLCGAWNSMLLVVDQFEELITLCRDPSEQAAFAATLVALSGPDAVIEGWRCCTLLTLRSDHLSRFESSNDLKRLYVRLIDEHNFDHLPGLNVEDIKRAIVEPARSVGLRFVPPTIVDLLASETAGLANGLPLLQFSLRRLWDTRPPGPRPGTQLDLVTQSMADALPDVRRALGYVAEGIFQKLTSRQQEICARVLQELVLLDENFEEPLRRRRSRAELLRVLAGRFPGASVDVVEVERLFTSAGLLRRYGEDDNVQLEVAHEALLRHWERVRQALNGSEAKHRLHAVKQIGREAAEWRANGGREDFLKLHGEPLRMARNYCDQGWLADDETMAYLQACLAREQAAQERAAQLEAAKQSEQQAHNLAIATEGKRKKLRNNAALLLALAAILVASIAYFAKVERAAGLTTIASLGDRLSPWEGLDLAYNVAKSGGPDYRFALGHALERMEDSWVLGKRDSPLFSVGGGSALLQFDASKESQKLLVYLVDPYGRPNGKPIAVDLGRTSDALAQAQVGPAIGSGSNKGKQILLLVTKSAGGGYHFDAHLLDARATTSLRLAISAEPSVRQRADELSPIRFSPDGIRAIWSAIDYGALDSQIQELRAEDLNASIRVVTFPGAEIGSPISSIAYRSVGDSTGDVVTGRLDGSIYCGNQRLELDVTKLEPMDTRRLDMSPLRTIVTRPDADVFAAIRYSGQVLAGSCSPHTFHLLQLVSSDPGSLQVSRVEERGDPPSSSWVVSYFDSDRQLRCYAFDPATSSEPRWWLCNAAQPLGSSVQLTATGWQLVIEKSDVAAVRRYPNEELSRKGRQGNVRQAGDTMLRWSSKSGVSDRQSKGKDSPWVLQSGDLFAKEGRRIEAAALSPNGRRVVWVERLNAADYRSDISESKDANKQITVSLVRSMAVDAAEPDPLMSPQEGFAQTVAVSDSAGVAYVQAIPGSSGALVRFSDNKRTVQLGPQDGQVQCLGYSPSGKYFVFGTAGGALRRLDMSSSGAEKTALSRNQDEAQEGRAKTSVTACAVADDGAAAAGYLDGQVVYFAPDRTPLHVTERTVYGFNVPIKDVRIEHAGTPRRVAALGEWQINNCVHSGLPGQTIRAWDMESPVALTPIVVACFPNATIATLGDWGVKKVGDSSDGCPSNSTKGEQASKSADLTQTGLCMVTGSGERRWHACPTCGDGGDSAKNSLTNLITMALHDGAKELSDDELSQRYGFKLGMSVLRGR